MYLFLKFPDLMGLIILAPLDLFCVFIHLGVCSFAVKYFTGNIQFLVIKGGIFNGVQFPNGMISFQFKAIHKRV